MKIQLVAADKAFILSKMGRVHAVKTTSCAAHKTCLHHLELLRVGQIPWSWVVARDISLDVNVSPVDQPLLDILQHLLHHCIKSPQLSGYINAHKRPIYSWTKSKMTTNSALWSSTFLLTNTSDTSPFRLFSIKLMYIKVKSQQRGGKWIKNKKLFIVQCHLQKNHPMNVGLTAQQPVNLA